MSVRPIEPIGRPLDITLTDLPGSKSIANRALVCAALASGTSTLRGVAPGDDTVAMLDCLERLGVGIGLADDGATATVAGVDGVFAPGPVDLPPLRGRPMADLHRALGELGASFAYGELDGHLPAVVSGGRLRGGTISLPGDITSQYVTALMLIAPYLADGLRIELTTPLVSRPYLEITRAVMASFGATDVEVTERSVSVAPGRYRATEYRIEVDASSASYPMAAAAILGGRVTIDGLGAEPLQGDAAFADLLAAMGCELERTATTTTVRSVGALRGIEVDMADISDTVPTLAVVAPFASTETRITGIGFIRRKESDRIGDVVAELVRCGVDADEEADGMRIAPSSPVGARIETHHDHRLAMAFALVGLAVEGIEIADPEVVSKSWPEYWAMIRQLGATDV